MKVDKVIVRSIEWIAFSLSLSHVVQLSSLIYVVSRGV